MNRNKLAYGLVICLSLILIYQNCGKSNLASNASLSSTTPQYMAKEIIVRMNDSNGDAQLRQWATSLGLVLKDQWPDMYMTHWTWSADHSMSEMQTMMDGQSFASSMMYAEPNYIVNTLEQTSASNVQLYSWSDVQAMSTTQQYQTSAPIQESALWSQLSSGLDKPIIAVIDTGIDLSHQAFIQSGALWVNKGEIPGNGIDDDNNGYVDDVNGWNFLDNNNDVSDLEGHGTHCAGIVLGVGQNIFASPLSAAKIQIMPLKFIGPNGGATSDAVNAVMYAVKNGAKVLSNSWGGPTPSFALEDAINYAYSKGVVFVAAAGNNSANIDTTPQYPASYTVPNIISVAATDANDKLATFSNYGPGSVNLAAPGVSILSTYPTNMFAYLSGTSMATPFVAGTAILMAYERPQMSGYQIKSLVIASADPDGSLNGFLISPSRLDSLVAVQNSETATLNTSEPAFTPKYGVLNQSSGSVPGANAGGCGLVMKTIEISGGGRGGGPTLPGSPNWGFALLPFFIVLVLRARKQRPFEPRNSFP